MPSCCLLEMLAVDDAVAADAQVDAGEGGGREVGGLGVGGDEAGAHGSGPSRSAATVACTLSGSLGW
ncbi:hypothetical protein GCM10009792_19380 [Microcella alkalica]